MYTWAKTDAGRARDGFAGIQKDCVARSLALALQTPYWAVFKICDSVQKGYPNGVGMYGEHWHFLTRSCGFRPRYIHPDNNGWYIVEWPEHVAAGYGRIIFDDVDTATAISAANCFWVKE